MFFLILIVSIIIFLPLMTMKVDKKSENTNQNYKKHSQDNKTAEKVTQTIESISFPEYNPEEYQRQKREREDKALNGCQFFEAWNVDVFQENVEFLHNKQCPYCKCNLPERKGKSYKCPECKEKIYRLKDIATNFEGLFTEAQKEVRTKILAELSKRKNFLKVYSNACNYIKFDFDNDKNLNIKRVFYLLHEAAPYIKSPKKVDQLRMCRFYEAEAQDLYGEPSEALNSWLSVAYIDLWGWYNTLYSDKDFTHKELKEMGQLMWQSSNNSALYALKQILKHRPDFENLKDLFWYNAKEISTRIKYKPPLSIDEAWEKLLKQYHVEQNN